MPVHLSVQLPFHPIMTGLMPVHPGSQRLETDGWPSHHPFNLPHPKGLIILHPCRSPCLCPPPRGSSLRQETARETEKGLTGQSGEDYH